MKPFEPSYRLLSNGRNVDREQEDTGDSPFGEYWLWKVCASGRIAGRWKTLNFEVWNDSKWLQKLSESEKTLLRESAKSL